MTSALAKLIRDAPADKFTIVPRCVTDSFLAWASPLVDLGCRVFGDKNEWTARYETPGFLHRHASAPDTPSRLETINPGVRTPRGFTCSTTQDLLDAYRMLGSSEVVIKPLSGYGAEGLLLVCSELEIRLYDFPLGTVCLEETLQLDKAEDGIVIAAHLTYMGGEMFGNGAMDLLLVGKYSSSTVFGLRPSATAAAFQERAAAATSTFLRAATPRGAGGLTFMSVASEPVLVDVSVGQFSAEHFPKLFVEAYARDACWMCWNYVPRADLDIWTFWARLLRRGLHFLPNNAQHAAGIFPLVFLRGAAGIFVAIGPSHAEVMELRRSAEELLREPVVARQLSSTSFAEPGRRVWVWSAPAGSGGDRRYTVPLRCLPLLRKGLDVIILPGGHAPTRECWEWARAVLGLEADQVVFTANNKGDTLDGDMMDDTLVSSLKALVVTNPADRFVVVPYAATPQFGAWLQRLGGEIPLAVVGDADPAWRATYATRAMLHRAAATPQLPSALEKLAEAAGVPFPGLRGFVCTTADELTAAWHLLAVDAAVVRPVACGGGYPVTRVTSQEQLRSQDLAGGAVLLEEAPAFDRAPDGMLLAPCVHWMESAMLGDPLDAVHVGAATQGLRPSAAPRAAAKKCASLSHALLAGLSPQGPGGLAYRLLGGRPVCVDVAVGRFTGAHAPRLFLASHAPGATFLSWRFKPPATLEVSLLWQRLLVSGMAFVPGGKSRRGIFPLLYLRGIEAYMLAIGTSDLDCAALYDAANTLLRKEAMSELESTTAGLTTASGRPRPVLRVLKNCSAVYGPRKYDATERHVLIAGGVVASFLGDAALAALLTATPDAEVIDATGLIAVPGFVDMHVHITGGGGEMGPASRTPEARLSELVDGGMTTVVGVLGTDCVSRSLENLLVKARGIEAEGLSCRMYTGAYRVPTPTLTGSVRRDLVLIEQCIGVGEVAVSDHRGTNPSPGDLASLAAEARVGGMLAGKAGIVYCHMGNGPRGLEPLREAMRGSDVPISAFVPTHMDRTDALIAEGGKWLTDGGTLDFTCRSIRCRKALQLYRDGGLPVHRVCVSSDSYGSCPTFDLDGNVTKYDTMDTKALLRFLRNMHFAQGWALEDILPLMTSSPAATLKLPRKGRLEVGADADVLLLDAATLNLMYVVAKGQVLKTPAWTQAGMCEKKNKRLRPAEERGNPI